MEAVIFLVIAFIIDLIIGDPDWILHPVVIMGKLISSLEKLLRKIEDSPLMAKSKGTILALTVILISYLSISIIIQLAAEVNLYFSHFLEIFLLSLSLALKGLITAGSGVYQALTADNLELGRQKVNLIVGRDCSEASRGEVIRAVVETLAENSSDGILAPAFYYLLGGLPLAVAYKAVNTLDSMLGYKNEKYLNFGAAAARIDDLFNFIPARITALLMIVASFLINYDYRAALKTVLNDAPKHPSPNAGFPEAAAAGALSLRFGGVNYYHGEKSFRAYIGQKKNDFELTDILRLNKLIYLTAGLFLITAAGLVIIF